MRRYFGLFLAVCAIVVLAAVPGLARFGYEIGEQREVLTVQENGTVLLTKEFTFHVLASSNENGTDIWVGLPTGNTSVTSAVYIKDGREVPVNFKIKEGNEDEQYVSFTQFPAIEPGETGRFRFTAQIPDLIYWLDKAELDKDPRDQMVSLSYVPAWWEKGVVRSLTLVMDFTGELNLDEVKFRHNQPVMGAHPQGTRFVWEYSNLAPNTQKQHAVILPRQYFAEGFKPEKDWMPLWAIFLIVFFVGGGIGLVIWALTYTVKNQRYQTPVAYMKGNKAYTSFDPVECAIFFNLSTNLIAQLIVMGLVKKNVIEIVDQNTMRRLPTIERLTWYEELFLDSVNNQVQINPTKWKDNYQKIMEHFWEQVEGYCGRQTQTHYMQWFKKTTFTEQDDPRWVVIQEQLASGLFDHPNRESLNRTMPGFSNIYFPLFYMTIIDSSLQKENRNTYNHYFPGATGGGGGTGGTGCACACACACASSGGCT